MPNAHDAPAEDGATQKTRATATTVLRRWLVRAAEPAILFPAAALLMLGAIWGTTLNIIKNEYAATEHTAALSSHQLANTYEAQIVRALREIDQTLKVVKSAQEVWGQRDVLLKLKARALLPPTLVFTVSVVDDKGDVVASTRPLPKLNVADWDSFQSQRLTDTFSVSQPRQNPESGAWELQFSRRLVAANGEFSGIAMVTVDAAYFVSSYDYAELGEHGMLGILGTDGMFRVRRSGETVSAGDMTDYSAVVVHDENEVESEATLPVHNPWDDVLRYTSARQLYDLPLVVMAGLSADEQLATAHRHMHTYLWRAAGGSLLLLVFIAMLERMSRQLALSRQQALEEKLANAVRIEYLAYHDGLTTLPNRSLFSKLLGQSIHQARRNNRQLAVLFLDLDRFKNVNDTLGHEAGDQLLQEVAVRLKTCLRDSDTVARLGGDEFVVLLPELDEEKYVATVAQKILSAIAQPFILRGDEFRVTASVGISTYPQDGLDEQTLTKNADTAMYQAKEVGKNNFQFFSEQLNAESLERLTLESSLRHALERHEFQLYYQPKQDIHSGNITGMEALLRWHHPDLGIVAPMQFIPVAEETGLIVPIGRWALGTACRQNVIWQNRGFPSLNMAVNLTARQFYDEHLLQDLRTILADTGMAAHLLELEISESLLMRDVEKTLRILTALTEMGIRIAIDDFGIGYFSLSMLKRFPIDTIKIDRSFIRDVASVAEDKHLTEAIIAIGRTLSLTVVAQGVETKEQAEYLRVNACDEIQGFYLNKPVPADQIDELLRSL